MSKADLSAPWCQGPSPSFLFPHPLVLPPSLKCCPHCGVLGDLPQYPIQLGKVKKVKSSFWKLQLLANDQNIVS